MKPGVLAGAALALLGACGRCGLPPDPGVKVVVSGMPTTLDWNTSDPTSWVNYPVMHATQRGLTGLTPEGGVGPGLAERWSIDRLPDGHQQYTFHLRPGVVWSDGTPLVAEDFVLGLRRAALGREAGEVYDIVGGQNAVEVAQRPGVSPAELEAALARMAVSAPDPQTVRIVLTQPRSYFLARIASVYVFFPAPSRVLQGKSPDQVAELFDRPRDGSPPALGPFRVESWDRAAERVRLVPNPRSAFGPVLGAGAVLPTAVTLMTSEVGAALYQRGRVDSVFLDNPLALRGVLPPDVRREPLLSTYFLAFNTQRPPLDQPEVRRAIALAIDREELLRGLLPSPRTTSALLPAALPGAATPAEAAALPHFNLPEARELLRRAGGVTRPLRVVFHAEPSFVPEEAIAERLRDQLGRVGIQVTLDARFDFSHELERRAADGFLAPDLYLRRLGADFAHPKTFFSLFERGGNHHTGWEHVAGGKAIDDFEALIARGDAEADPVLARPFYVEAERLLVAEQAVVAPLYHPDRYLRVRPGLEGLEVNPFNFLSLSQLRLTGSAR